MSESAITCCNCFINIVLPTQAEILTFDTGKSKGFYGTFTTAIIPTITKYNGTVRKFVGEGLEYYFQKTSDATSVNAFREVLECSIILIEQQTSLSDELEHKGLPQISYKIGVDYETLILRGGLILDKPAVWSSAFEICAKTPPDGIIVGEDLAKIIMDLPELQNSYHLQSIGEFNIAEKRRDYKVYLLKNNLV